MPRATPHSAATLASPFVEQLPDPLPSGPYASFADELRRAHLPVPRDLHTCATGAMVENQEVPLTPGIHHR